MTDSMHRALTSEAGPTGPGAALRWLRVQTGLSLDEVAREAGVAPEYLNKVEAGATTASPAWIGAVAGAIALQLGRVG